MKHVFVLHDTELIKTAMEIYNTFYLYSKYDSFLDFYKTLSEAHSMKLFNFSSSTIIHMLYRDYLDDHDHNTEHINIDIESREFKSLFWSLYKNYLDMFASKFYRVVNLLMLNNRLSSIQKINMLDMLDDGSILLIIVTNSYDYPRC